MVSILISSTCPPIREITPFTSAGLNLAKGLTGSWHGGNILTTIWYWLAVETPLMFARLSSTITHASPFWGQKLVRSWQRFIRTATFSSSYHMLKHWELLP